MIKTCAICGKIFDVKTTAIYCSDECRKKGLLEHSRAAQRRFHARRAEKRRKAQRAKEYRYDNPIDLNNYPLRRLNGENICMWCGDNIADYNPKQRFCCDNHAEQFYNLLFGKNLQ